MNRHIFLHSSKIPSATNNEYPEYSQQDLSDTTAVTTSIKHSIQSIHVYNKYTQQTTTSDTLSNFC